ncbi:DNA recombination protein RmuC, partial [Flavobacteriales bacterium]|nr:DNA recombination protein RmuC [Flavobacteriales bacterium]
ANKILEEKSVKFTAQNKENIDSVLAPLSDKLKSFETKVQDTYEKGLKERSELKEQVIQLSSLNQTLSKDAQNLTRALTHDNKTQGNWGELILEKILKESGLTEGEEYSKQHSTNNEDGKRIQPDFLIKLPDDKHIIIDSKVSLVAYEQFVNTEEKGEKEAHLKAHILSVRSHIKLLSEKNYQTGLTINSPDFVLLFMPIEPAFSLAMQKDKEIYQYAWSKNIVIVSPTTLLATIRTIASIWKQEKQNKNTQEIAKQAAALYEKFVGFLDDMEKIERGISQVDGAYKNAINKLKTGSGNLIRRTENMKKLGLNPKKQISEKFLEDNE